MDKEKDSIDKNKQDIDIEKSTSSKMDGEKQIIESSEDNDNDEFINCESNLEVSLTETLNGDDIKGYARTNSADTENKKYITKKVKFIIVGIIILIMCMCINNLVNKYDELAYPGSYLYTKDISGMNELQLVEEINNIKGIINKNNIIINTGNKNYELNLEKLILEYNEEELINEILNENIDKNNIQKLIAILNKKEEKYMLDIKLNDEVLQSELNKISEETAKLPKEPSVVIEGEEIMYIEGEVGEKIDVDNLEINIQNSIKGSKLYENDLQIESNYIDYKPSINIAELKKVNHKISTYSTTYTPGGGRGYNVELAAKKIDDLILMPGDEFSYEQSVGPVTSDNGYTYANVIVDGEFVPGIGGGVCQVSSTLYNTQLKAGILPTERRNHSKPVGYVPKGLDATLASGLIDYKFKNTYEYPIVINTKASNGILTIEFWSNNNTLEGITYKPVGYSDGNVSNTYLYGYDESGNKVYEKHVDTSVYREDK